MALATSAVPSSHDFAPLQERWPLPLLQQTSLLPQGLCTCGSLCPTYLHGPLTQLVPSLLKYHLLTETAPGLDGTYSTLFFNLFFFL